MLRQLVSRRWKSLRVAEQSTTFSRFRSTKNNSDARGGPSNGTTSQQRVPYSFRQAFSWLGISAGAFIVSHIFAEHFYWVNSSYGISMLPTISSYGDNLITSKWYRRGRDIQIGDLVSYTHPIKSETSAVKRVIGLPGDFVLRGTPGVGAGEMIQIPEGHCWVVGDNLAHSRDSRHFGPLPLALITGKVIGTIAAGWPIFRRFPDPFVVD